MKRFEWLVRRGSDGLIILGGLCLVLMMLQIVVDVALKYVFNSPIEGNLEVVSFYYMVGVVFLPLAMVELRHEHISVDLFIQMLPRRGRSYVYVFGCVVSLVFFSVLTYQTFLDAVHATRINEIMMGSIYVTIWPSRWTLPVGFTLIALAIVIHAIKALCQPLTFEPAPEAADSLFSDVS
jgi:TRAP-type C4-dicarboxylate transport system permease small subunit